VLGVAELVDVAALAIAAPPPATAAVTARVVRSGLIRWDKLVHLLWWPAVRIAAEYLKFV
jgi:hypothetical protein